MMAQDLKKRPKGRDVTYCWGPGTSPLPSRVTLGMAPSSSHESLVSGTLGLSGDVDRYVGTAKAVGF